MTTARRQHDASGALGAEISFVGSGRRRCFRRRIAFATSLIFVVGATLFAGCDEESASFRVDTVETDGLHHRNEPVVIRFSRPVSRTNPVKSVVRVEDDRGRRIAYSDRIENDRLVLSPTDSWGWPAATRLRIAVMRPIAGAFRSSAGASLADGHEATINIGNAYADLGVAMTLESPAIDDTKTTSVATDVRADFELACRFSLPIDPASLADIAYPAVEGFCEVEDGRRLPLDLSLELGADGRTVVVHPWGNGGRFLPGCRHQIRLRRDIRALTGRRLDEPVILEFRTSRDAESEGVLRASFRVDELRRAGNRHLDPNTPFARAKLEPISAVVFDDELSSYRGSDIYRPLPIPWSPEPARVQYLVPGVTLGDEPGLITGFAFYSTDAVPDDLVFPRVMMRIGYAPDGVESLSPEFSANYARSGGDLEAGSGVHRTMPLGSVRGEWSPAPSDRPGWVDVAFERPFFYTGGSRSLVVEILNAKGVRRDDAVEFTGLGWLTGRVRENVVTVCADGDDTGSDVGIESTAPLATRIDIRRYRAIETDWQHAEVDDPEYYIRRSEGDVDASGREDVDFRFLFKGRHADGTETDWIGLDERLDGCRDVKVKLVFLERPGSESVEPVEVRELRIRYRDSRVSR